MEGDLGNELMRIAYVAMTRPRRLLMIAMPENKKLKEYKRFPVDKWDYEYLQTVYNNALKRLKKSMLSQATQSYTVSVMNNIKETIFCIA